MIGLLRDWGTRLLFRAIKKRSLPRVGREESAEAMLPLTRSGKLLDNQPFQMASADIAFRLTAMNHEMSEYQSQLARLLAFSPLRAIHWVNTSHHHVPLKTISKS